MPVSFTGSATGAVGQGEAMTQDRIIEKIAKDELAINLVTRKRSID